MSGLSIMESLRDDGNEVLDSAQKKYRKTYGSDRVNKKALAAALGVEEKDLSEKNVAGAMSAMRGAQVVAEKGEDPVSKPIVALKAVDPVADQKKAEENLKKMAGDRPKDADDDTQNKLLLGLLSLGTTLIGGAVGGYGGAAGGAQAGLAAQGAYSEAKKGEKAELLAKEKAAKEDERYAKEFGLKEKELAQKGSIEQQKLALEKSKEQDKSGPASYEKKLAKLSGTDKQRFDHARMGYSAVLGMEDALNQGVNTFSLVGDNPYTLERSKFEEALGRMQSGGAINKEEAERFRRMAPSVADSAEIQQKKMGLIKMEMAERLQTLGFSPDEIPGIQQSTEMIAKGRGRPGEAFAGEAPKMPSFDEMSEEELKKYLGK